MADSTTVSITDVESFKIKALQWAQHFKSACLLTNNNYCYNNRWDCEWLLAVDALEELQCGPGAFEELKKFLSSQTYAFGFFTYDLKNQIEKTVSEHEDGIRFPDLYFFKPRYLIEITGNKLTINRNYPETYEWVQLINGLLDSGKDASSPSVRLQQRTTKEKYIQNVSQIKGQIGAGDYYELNYCNEFFATGQQIDPVGTFTRLNDKAKAPFSCFFKLGSKYLLCASPERFLKKEASRLITQPIKGTIRRSADVGENEKLKWQLQNDEKERAENVMIVDLVRNDLSKSAVPGTVKVDELFGIYEFNNVNQMISTVSAQLREDIHPVDAIKNAFPMGSMTGAPKVNVMHHIERYEDFKRGLYSGAVGYFKPNGDFDFNVVIRSILYNADTGYVSAPAGGAITYDSVAEKEYDEVLLKAGNMVQVLNEGY